MNNRRWQRVAIRVLNGVFHGRCLWPHCNERIVSDVSREQFNVQLLEHMAKHSAQHRGYAAKDGYERAEV